MSLEAHKWTQALNDEIFMVAFAPTVTKDPKYTEALGDLLKGEEQPTEDEGSPVAIREKRANSVPVRSMFVIFKSNILFSVLH